MIGLTDIIDTKLEHFKTWHGHRNVEVCAIRVYLFRTSLGKGWKHWRFVRLDDVGMHIIHERARVYLDADASAWLMLTKGRNIFAPHPLIVEEHKPVRY